jgi:hypothetical protein
VSVRRCLRRVAAPALFSALALASPALAGAATTSPTACEDSPLSQPFLAFGDARSYELAPGGDFEGSPSSWSLGGGAGVVAGSETAGVTGSVGASSLSLPAGASAQSPGACVNAAYPSFRFFARSDRPGSVVAVSVVYQTVLGQTALPVGAVVPSRNWAPTTSLPTLSAILAGASAPVELRFTTMTGSAQIDDVFIDPHTMH